MGGQRLSNHHVRQAHKVSHQTGILHDLLEHPASKNCALLRRWHPAVNLPERHWKQVALLASSLISQSYLKNGLDLHFKRSSPGFLQLLCFDHHHGAVLAHQHVNPSVICQLRQIPYTVRPLSSSPSNEPANIFRLLCIPNTMSGFQRACTPCLNSRKLDAAAKNLLDSSLPTRFFSNLPALPSSRRHQGLALHAAHGLMSANLPSDLSRSVCLVLVRV